CTPRDHPSFPTRRSSDLGTDLGDGQAPTGWQLMQKQIERNVGGLAVSGDSAPPHFPIGQPLVDPLVGALVLAGVFGFTLTAHRPEHLLAALWLWVPTLFVALFTDRPPAMSRLT